MNENEDILLDEQITEPTEDLNAEPDEVILDPDVQTDIPVIPDDWAMPEPFHKYMTMADGTELDGHAVRTSLTEGLWVFMDKSDMGYLEIVQIFSNPEKTSVIQSHEDADRTETYTGYTKIASINTDNEGKFIIGLAKPAE